MKTKEMLNQIKTLLNIEVKLEEAKLENGTIISADSLEKDSDVFIVTDDEKVAMPVGEYILEDGRILVVEVEGIILEVKSAEKEEEETADLEDKPKEEEELADESNFEKRIKDLEDAIAFIKEKIEEKIEEKVEEEEKEEKEELSAASKPIKHNPESTTQKKEVELSKNRPQTTLDRVLNKLNK